MQTALMIVSSFLGVGFFILLVLFIEARYEDAINNWMDRFSDWSKTLGKKK